MSKTEEKNELDQKVDKILECARAEIASRGYYTNSTCNTNSYGWSLLEHLAMEKIARNCPSDLNVSKNYKFEVWDWTITEK